MRKVLLGSLISVGAAGAIVGAVAFRQAPIIRKNVFVGPVAVGGLEPEAAAKKIRGWWETERRQPLHVVCSAGDFLFQDKTPGELGVMIDDAGIVAKLPQASFTDRFSSEEPERFEAPLTYRSNGANLVPLAMEVKAKSGPVKPAAIKWVNGAVVRTPESTQLRLDTPKLFDAVVAALESDRTVDLPAVELPKTTSDAKLDEITDLVAEFSTRFPASNRPRCANIKLAAKKLDGVILMPGEKLSFNGTVGRRTKEAGFQEAGVYKQGRHDVGIGGGICQVSTTLYNAALFANVKIARRSNHSMPVAYVPVGRDATVDYGSLDLVIVNDGTTPLAVVNTYQPGKLTFRLLGKKDPTLSVKLTQDGQKSWDRGEKTVVDKTLAPGARRVTEKGSRGHSVNTYRLVYRNGVLEKKEPLGRSYYGGGPRIVSVGPNQAVSAQAGSLNTETAG